MLLALLRVGKRGQAALRAEGLGRGGANALGVLGAGIQVGGNAAVAPSGTAMRAMQDEYGARNMSLVVLFHNEYDSLIPVFKSWLDGGLIDYVDEVVFLLNGVENDMNFRKLVPAIHQRIPSAKLKVVPQYPNLAIGLAIKRLAEISSCEFVLLLEKDWQLIESRSVMQSRLRDSKILVGSGLAQVIRQRHRINPGVPIHALIMHAGRESSIMRQQPNLLCFVHHWQHDPTIVYPGAGIMKRCGGEALGLEEEDVFCAPARFCQWTNNPAVFKKKWFLEEVANEYEVAYKKELAAEGNKSPFLDFEYYTNWRDHAWNSRNFSIAVGAGLFSHAETEHKHFNTFWYAHYRLRTDLEEIRNQYLANETVFKRQGGVHFDPSSAPPPPLIERYPVDFVRKYHVPGAFAGTLDDQRALIAAQLDPYVEKYRVSKATTVGRGFAAAGGLGQSLGASLFATDKSKLQIPWRQVITDMHFATEKAMMIVAPEQPHEMSITLVTSLLDLDRHTVDRDFSLYINAMQEWLTHEYKKVVYTSPEIAEQLMINVSDAVRHSTKFVYTSRAELRSKWIGPDNYDKIQEIRNDPKWRAQAEWLGKSPQARLEDYNPLVMSKMYMMREASRFNHWNTSHFLYIDAKHNCRNPTKLTPRSDHIVRAHMLDKFLLTYFDYVPATEVHGFEYGAFNSWVNIYDKQRHMVKIGRGGIFGGSPFVIEAMTAMYDVALTASLREGLMGTEENILAILMAQVPQYVDPFSNNWACRAVLAKEHICTKPSPHYNCGMFVWAAEDAPPLLL
jgi:Bacterial protein of unknown function (HtrL_YibB)